MMGELKLCPFCPDGGEPEMIVAPKFKQKPLWPTGAEQPDKYNCWVMCKKCNTVCGAVEYPTEAEAAAAWNRRAAQENEPIEMSPKHKAALAELVEMMNEDENKPLTLDELRKMQKQYVWIVDSNPDMTFSGWAVCDGKAVYYLYFNKDCPVGSASIDLDDGYGKTWLAYSRKPEGSEKA